MLATREKGKNGSPRAAISTELIENRVKLYASLIGRDLRNKRIGEHYGVAFWDMDTIVPHFAHIDTGKRFEQIVDCLTLVDIDDKAIRLVGGIRTVPSDVVTPLVVSAIGKHTEFTLRHLDKFVKQALKLHRLYYCTCKLLHRLKNKQVTTQQANNLILQAGRGYVNSCRGVASIQGGMMPWSRLGLVDHQFRQGLQTAWGLYYAFCKVAKSNPPLRRTDQCLRFLKLLTGKK